MTLISNAIHLEPQLRDSFIVCCADTRLTFRDITNPKEKYIKGRKLFKIEYLNGSVSFWGATALFENSKQKSLSEWLPVFIKKSSHHTTLRAFAEELRYELNKKMHKPFLGKEASGFHLCRIPEFMHFSNCGLDQQTGNYGNITDSFRGIGEDFLGRDISHFKWDGSVDNYPPIRGIQLYRNGSIKVHSLAWDKLDEVFATLFRFPDFKYPYSYKDEDVIKFTKQKLNFISSIYNNWAKTKIVGAPWDIIILRFKQ